MIVERLNPLRRRQAIDLLDELGVSMFGLSSPRLHAALADDALDGAIDCRIAREGDAVCGLVMAAPPSYWYAGLLRHWTLAFESIVAHVTGGARYTEPRGDPSVFHSIRPEGFPLRTWNDPGDAWRVIIVGTAGRVRGQGVAAELYRRLMADRPLVARIAADNTASIRLHQSLGWHLYPDRHVLLAVHEPHGTALARA